MKPSNKKFLSTLAVTVPIVLTIGGGFLQYGKDKGIIFKSLEAFESRLASDENRYASDIERLRIESYKRWEDVKKGMVPIEELRREQAVTSQRLKALEAQQKAFRSDMKQYQKDTQKSLQRILETLTDRRS